jgi:aryl-alcohol dehydrogenase (NADP+)
MSFGAIGNTDHTECIRMIRTALDNGVNSIDTADVYSAGESETIVGRALAGRRDDVVLATKAFWPMGGDVNRRGGSRRWIRRALDESLRRLGTDRVDIYYLHKPDPHTDLDESIGVLNDLVQEGVVALAAVSTFPGSWLMEAAWTADRRGYVRPRVEQPPYSILTRGVEHDVLPTCERLGMGAITWSPLCSGWLTGKYRRGEAAPSGSRGERWARTSPGFDSRRPAVQRKYEIVAALEDVAREAGLTMTQLAIGFCLAHRAVSSVIIGPRTPEQLDDLLACADVCLDAATLDAIDAIAEPGINVDRADAWIPSWVADPSSRRRT